MKKEKFNFSKQLKTDLAANGKAWEELLFKACQEGKLAEVPASVFAEALRASGFRCGTGPARAAYKAVRDGKDQKAMVAAVTAVKAKRKAAGKDAGKDADTLVGALAAAMAAAKSGNLEVAETWLVKAQAIIETAKRSTTQAIEKMGGIVKKTA